MKQVKQTQQKIKPTYCDNCGGRTGFGFGDEPMRYDTICCSSECANKIFNTERRK